MSGTKHMTPFGPPSDDDLRIPVAKMQPGDKLIGWATVTTNEPPTVYVRREPTTPAPSLPTQASDDDGRETAPLDPGAVKAGDVVTVRFVDTGDEISTTAYQPRDLGAGHVYILGWPLNKPGGVHGLALRNFELLDHQPAPEPEPEWKPGTVYAARLAGGSDEFHVWVIDLDEGGRAFMDDGGNAYGVGELLDVRPLVVIDPASGSVRQRIADVLRKRFGGEQGAWLDDADAVLSTLGLDGAR